MPAVDRDSLVRLLPVRVWGWEDIERFSDLAEHRSEQKVLFSSILYGLCQGIGIEMKEGGIGLTFSLYYSYCQRL